MYNRQSYNRHHEYGRHIRNEEEYRDAVRNLRKGERWKMDDLMARTDVDFNEEEFTPYDYAYMVNALHTDYDISERPEQYMKMAKDHLRNDSFPERGPERAYHDAQKRARRMNRYEDYSPRNEYEPHYEYENRRRYNERNSYRDRDNDGRYNE